MAGFFECGNGLSGSINVENFLSSLGRVGF